MYQPTSLSAYHEIKPTLGERQKEVYEILSLYPDLTNTEISEKLGLPINSITPRIFELRKYGKVEESCKRKCRVTGRTVIAWRVCRVLENTQLTMF